MESAEICIVTHLFLPHVGGIEKVAYEQGKRLLQRGFKVLVLTSDIAGQKNYVYDGINVHCYSALKVGFGEGIPYIIPKPDGYGTFLKCIRNSDLVHVHGHPYMSSYLAVKVAKKFSKPVVLTQHNTFIEYGGLWDFAEKLNDLLIGKGVLRDSDKIITVSKATLNYVLSLGANPNKAEVLYNGVDIKRFRPFMGKRDAKRQLNFPEDSFIVLTVRRLVYKNGIDILLESAKLAVKKNPKILFLVAGGGPDFQRIRLKIKEFSLEENFKLLGFIPDEHLPLYYNASDAFVLPSKSGEGMPLVLLEAMACGLPVVATNVGGVPEIIDKRWGKVVPPSDAVALADAILDFSYKDTSHISEELRKMVVQSYSWEANVERLIEIYEEFI